MEIDDPRLKGGRVFPQPERVTYQDNSPKGGLTLRQHFAGLAMQGLAAHNGANAFSKGQIVLAVMMADELIKALVERKDD